MKRYPELQPAMSVASLRPSHTSRLLTPGIVLVTVLLLVAISITGIVIAAAVFSSNSPHTMSVSAAQAFVLTASTISIIYVMLHLVSAVYNDPVGVVRPPKLKLHACCFIVARIALVSWMICLIASCAVASRPYICLSSSRDCKLQIVDVAASSLAFISTGIILTALESCQYPFQTPELLRIRMITCRVSSFGDDIMERSTSSVFSFEDVIYDEKPSAISHRCSIKRKPLPKSTSMPGEYPEERRLTPLLPMAKRPISRGWGEEWTHLVRDTGSKGKGILNSDSAISFSSDSSGHMSSCGSRSDLSVSNRRGRPRTVTPSSSISNLSRRSPLSTMRSAEFPDVVIRPELRFLPPTIPPPHEWNLSKTASLSQLLPVADVHCLQRRPSVTLPPELLIRKPSRELPPLPRKPAPIIRRNTLDSKIPGAYIECGLSLDHELKLEAHARKIEVESIARSESTRKPNGPVRLPAGDFEKLYATNPIDSRSRYRGQKPVVQRSQTAAPAKNARPDSTQLMEAIQVEYVKVKPLRRLSLGEISPGLGNLWEV